MALFKGGALRMLQTALYALAFCCAAIVLGIFSYFLAVLAKHNRDIPTWEKAVEGMSGAAVLYTICTTLLTCCLAGITALSLLGIVLDLCFMGAFIAIAVLTRHGANSCRGTVNTPIGSGLASTAADGAGTLRYACKLNTAVFAVSIIAAFLFLLTAIMQVVLMRHHKKEKRFGPSPANNYTSGSGRSRFGRKTKETVPVTSDAEKGVLAVPGPTHAVDMRPSHDTAYTGDTVAAPGVALQKDTEIVDSEVVHTHAHDHGHGAHAPHVGWNPHADGTTAVHPPPPPPGPHGTLGTNGSYYTAPVVTDYNNTTTGTARNF